MNVHDNITYAVINVDTIVNLFIGEDNTLAQETAKGYGEDCFAVNCSNYKVCIGDIFKNGKFYNGETSVEIKDSSFDAQIFEANNNVELLTNAILDLSNLIATLMVEKE